MDQNQYNQTDTQQKPPEQKISAEKVLQKGRTILGLAAMITSFIVLFRRLFGKK